MFITPRCVPFSNVIMYCSFYQRTTLSAVHAASSFSSKTLDRDGSAHSDYFSLSDEPHLEENSFSAQKKTSATFPGGSPKHSLVKTSLTSDLEEEVPKGRGRNHMSIKFDDRIGDDDVDYANSCPGLEGLEEKGEKNIIESVQGTNKENDNGSSKASSLLGETEKPSGPIYNSTDSLHSYQFNEQQNRSSELLSTYEVENKGLLAREESVRSRAQEIIEQNFNQRHMTQRYKNQHLSADNPLLVTEDYISDDGPCSRAKSLVPNLPKTEPFSIKSSSAPQHCFSNLNEDVSSHEVSALGNVISMPDRRSSSLSNVTYTKESIKEELKYPNIKPPSPISSQQEEQSSDLTQKQLAIGDTFTISSKQAVVSNSGNNTLGQTYSVTQNKNKGSNYNPNQPFCQTYTISKSASNSDNIVSHIDSEQNSSRDISLQNNFNSQPSQSLIKSRSLEFDSPKRNSASSSIHSGRITPEILEPAISYEMDKFSHRSASSQALSRAMEYSKESVLGRLQSGSTNKLMPVTLVKPSEFTRSLRNNTVQSNRRTVSRSSPVKASGAFSQKLDNRNDVPNSLSLANPLNLKNKKVSDVMSKIKMNKPTCDVNYRTVKKNIERQHINLYTKDSRPSSLVGTKSSCCSVDGDSISSRLGFASKRSTRARSVDRGSVKRAPSVARSTVSSILDPVKNLQQGSIEKNLQDGSHDSFASRIEKTSNPSEKKERNEFECPSSIPNVRLRNSRYANMLRSKSSIDITEEQNDITSHNSARQSVPPISLKEINQESVDGSQLVDSSLKNNFSYSNDASLENIKLPLRVSLDTSTVSTSMNTLEMNLQPDSKAEKNKLPSHSANIPSSSLADIAADMTLTNERSQEKSEDPLPQPCIANESPQSAIGSCPERDSLTGIEDKEYASSTPRINGCQNQFHPSSSESHVSNCMCYIFITF